VSKSLSKDQKISFRDKKVGKVFIIRKGKRNPFKRRSGRKRLTVHQNGGKLQRKHAACRQKL